MLKRQWLSFVKSSKARTKIKQKLGIKVPKRKLLPKSKAGTLTSDRNVRIAKCCAPVPGEEVVGVRTTKRKISVHRAGCGNIDRIADSKRIRIKWDLAEKQYIVGIRVKARDRPGLLPAILKIISGNKVAIISTDAKTGKGKILQCNFNVKIRNVQQLESIIAKIKALSGVFEVERE
jgi:GTP pyrophosphokinase